ncbi:MAG: sulfite exporter TauE/SafE family protein [Acidobacteriaceae bacterium]
MDLLLGFVIAVLIATTGVGAGTMTAPLLILFLHVPVSVAVGTALAYSAAVKLLVVPVQIWRRQVVWRVLGLMLVTGVPGVVFGTILFRDALTLRADQVWLYLGLGSMIAFSSAWHIYRHFRPAPVRQDSRARPGWLAAAMLPVGVEVGFSSSGAGALGTAALLHLTHLEIPQVVGTDLAFGLCLSIVGGGLHLASGAFDARLLVPLIAGGLLGAATGSTLAPRIPARAMRLALSLWLLMIGIQLCWRATTLLERAGEATGESVVPELCSSRDAQAAIIGTYVSSPTPICWVLAPGVGQLAGGCAHDAALEMEGTAGSGSGRDPSVAGAGAVHRCRAAGRIECPQCLGRNPP